ncbi:MAG: hypothetical protein ABI858_12170 [Pseudoxanthomonas sp.]
MSGEHTPPPLSESVRGIYDAARRTTSVWSGTFAALRRLLIADFALARAALIRGLVLLFVATIMFGTTWALLTALAVFGLIKMGLGWGIALVVPLGISIVIGLYAMLHAQKSLAMADMDASRRQLALWFGNQQESDEARAAPPGGMGDAGAPPPKGYDPTSPDPASAAATPRAP